MKSHTGKKTSPYPEMRMVPRRHSGKVLPVMQVASLVVRNGMIIRQGGVPVDPPIPYDPEMKVGG